MNTLTRVWFITGCSKGLGRALAETVLQHGDRVVATARNVDTLGSLEEIGGDRVLVLPLDVCDAQAVNGAVDATLRCFGRIDVVVNNAGYGLAGAVEELGDAEARAQFDTNVFGVLNVLRAALPTLRQQRSGHILQISSVAGMVSTPGLGIYNASKYALEGLSEALALELGPFGVRVTLIEPGPFRTDWAGPSLVTPRQRIDAYAETAHKTIEMLNGYSGTQPGDPLRAARAMIEIVESERPPLRLPMGALSVERIRDKLARTARELDAWEPVSLATEFPRGG